MKVKTSITLSEDLLNIIDEESKQYRSRSDFIESALRKYIQEVIRQGQNKKDIEIINSCADGLNKEAEDVLTYQVHL